VAHRSATSRHLVASTAGSRLLNLPNTITAVRTCAAMALAVPAVTMASVPLAMSAYLTYWIGDIADGMAARRLRQETRAGAVLDIVADRACTALCAAALLVLRPGTALPVAVFLVQFMVLDCLLSLSFLRWPLLLSPNYFGEVHRPVYRWNWSPPAKALNSAGVVVLVIVAPSPLWPTALAVVVTIVKVVSLVTVSRLPTGRVDR
jgi:CDP-diacylglycerol--glycerol-3-phosphate 3-phosphatidyltransferase